MFGRIAPLELARLAAGRLAQRRQGADAQRDPTDPSHDITSARSASAEPALSSARDVAPARAASGRPARQGHLAHRSPRPRLPPPASASAAEALPRVVVTERDIAMDQNDCCTICLDALCVGAVATRLPCGHLFHQGCISSWLGKCNQCPVCRYELATGDAEYEQTRLKHMADRKLRLRLSDLQVKSPHEICRLAEHLGISIKGCPDKRQLVQQIAASPIVDIIEINADAVQSAASARPQQSTKAKLLASKRELNQRLVELRCISSRPSSAQAAATADDAPGGLPTLRLTSARHSAKLQDEADTNFNRRPSLTSAGQSIVGRPSSSSGGA